MREVVAAGRNPETTLLGEIAEQPNHTIACDTQLDEAFNEFRDRDVVKNRPVTLFANTNDGMIRAITLEPYTAPGGASVYQTSYATAGTQLWGFVPPLLVDDLEDNLTDHRITMDGTAVVKDVYFKRTRGARATTNADQYHSVLVTGMRGGEKVVEALCRMLPDADIFTLFYDPARV